MLDKVDDWINFKTNFIWTIVVDWKQRKKEEYLIFIQSSIRIGFVILQNVQ